jgi:hypothetical protein
MAKGFYDFFNTNGVVQPDVQLAFVNQIKTDKPFIAWMFKDLLAYVEYMININHGRVSALADANPMPQMQRAAPDQPKFTSSILSPPVLLDNPQS